MNTETKSWIARLLEEIALVDCEAFRPTSPVEKTDTVLGECTEAMRQTYALARFIHREAKQAKLDLEFSVDPAKEKELNQKWDELNDKHQFLMSLFWIAGQDHFKIWGHGRSLGVREGWKFVFSVDKKNSLQTLLEGLHG